MTALVDGYVMRSLFDDPTRVGPDVFADALVALITSLTTTTRPTADADLDDFDDWSRAELGAPAMAHRELDERIARAAVEVYRGAGRFEAVAVGAVAEEAGVSQRAVREATGPRWRLSTPIWQRLLLPEIEATAARARAETTEDPLRRLVAIMSVVAGVSARDPAVSNAFLHVVHSGPNEWSDADRSTRRSLTRLVVPELRDASDAGMLDRTVVATLADVEDAAELLAVNLLLRVVRSPARSAGAADYVLARLLPALRGGPSTSL